MLTDVFTRAIVAPAKVNLFLSIGGLRNDGYHEIDSVISRVGWPFDEIYVHRANKLSVKATRYAPSNERNLVWKMIRKLEDYLNVDLKYKIVIRKGIPPCSGLGGGSSDAASVMQYVLSDQEIKLSLDTQYEIAADVGKDIPFFLSKYPVALVGGLGEKVSALPSLPAKLRLSVQSFGECNQKTSEAFARIDRFDRVPAHNSQDIIKAIYDCDAQAVMASLWNDFSILYPSDTIKSPLHLTGTGTAQFAVKIVEDPRYA